MTDSVKITILLKSCRGALAALSQKKTYPADVEAAKKMLQWGIKKAEEGK